MRIAKQCDGAYIIKDLFNAQEIHDITDEIVGPYNSFSLKKEYNAGQNGPFWLALSKTGGYLSDTACTSQSLGDNPLLLSYGSKLNLIVKKILRPDFPVELKRINTNIQFQHQDSTFHHDGYYVVSENVHANRYWSWTFLMFANHSWNPLWGGEFCYQTPEGDFNYVPYIPGDCVLFNGWLQHKGASPNTFAEHMRVSCAWTFWCPDIKVDWRRASFINN